MDIDKHTCSVNELIFSLAIFQFMLQTTLMFTHVTQCQMRYKVCSISHEVCSTYDIFTGSMLVGVHLYMSLLNEAPSGSSVFCFTVTVSPSASKWVTVRVFSWSTVTLNVLSTVILGLALAAEIKLCESTMQGKIFARQRTS